MYEFTGSSQHNPSSHTAMISGNHSAIIRISDGYTFAKLDISY